MKPERFLLYVLLVISKISIGQVENTPSSLKKNKVVSVTSYIINTVESKVEECLNTPSWYQQNILDSTLYDNQGRAIMERIFPYQGRKKYSDTRFQYNNDGLLVKTLTYDNNILSKTDSQAYNKDKLISYRKLYYNTNNYLLFEMKTEYTLNNKKLPLEIRSLDPATGALNTLTVNTYNAKNQLIEDVLYEGGKEETNIKQRKKYTYHTNHPTIIKEIQYYRNREAQPHAIQKFDENGSLIEHITFDARHPEVVTDKTTIKRDNNQVIETNFDYVQEEKLPTGSGNPNETAPMMYGEKVFIPVQKKVTTFSKNGLMEITKFYKIDPSGKESFRSATKYDYQFGN